MIHQEKCRIRIVYFVLFTLLLNNYTIFWYGAPCDKSACLVSQGDGRQCQELHCLPNSTAMPRRITVFAKFEGKCLCEKPAVVCLAGQDMPDGPRVCQGISRNSAQDFTWSAQTWVSCHNYNELSIDLGQVQKWMDSYTCIQAVDALHKY